MNLTDIAAWVAIVASVLTAGKVFFSLETRIAVVESKQDSITDMIRQGFENIRRELDAIREDLRDPRK